MTRYPLYTSHHESNPQQVIFEHWVDCARHEPASMLLNRFKSLFILGKNYPENFIKESLDEVLMTSTIEEQLPFLNRCCYILVNRWQMNPNEKSAIVELTTLLKQVQSPGTTNRYDRVRKRLRLMVFHYTQSHFFKQLRRVTEFVREKGAVSSGTPLISLIDRYPYLYSHCLKANDASKTRLKLIREAQGEAQKQFEIDLSKYIAHTALRGERAPITNEPELKNPTLLTSKDLQKTLKHFVGRSTREGTYREMSSSFRSTLDQRIRFVNFKDNLFDYLTADIDPNYANRKFNYNLRKQLNLISPELHRKPVTDILMTRTYNTMLNHLVIESRQAPKHFVFMDLISNIGSTRTIGLLLKLVLLNRSVKNSLERRLGVLFQHYESHQHGGIQWLVRCFEKFNLAFTTHFGKINVSYVTAL